MPITTRPARMADRQSVKARWNEARQRADSGLKNARMADDEFVGRMAGGLDVMTRVAVDDQGSVVSFACWLRTVWTSDLVAIPAETGEQYYELLHAFAASALASGHSVCRAVVDNRTDTRESGWARQLKCIRYEPIGFEPVAVGVDPSTRVPTIFIASADPAELRKEALQKLQEVRRA